MTNVVDPAESPIEKKIAELYRQAVTKTVCGALRDAVTYGFQMGLAQGLKQAKDGETPA